MINELPKSIKVDLYGAIIDKNYYKKIASLIKELKLQKRLNIIISENKVSKLIKNYKLALHCASSETGPLVAIEYLSQGIPIIMFKTGEVSKIIEKYNTKQLMTDFSLYKWKDTTESFITDKNLQEETIEINNTIFKDNFSEDKYIEKCLKIYQSILNY